MLTMQLLWHARCFCFDKLWVMVSSQFQPHHQGIIIDFEWQHPQWAVSTCCTILAQCTHPSHIPPLDLVWHQVHQWNGLWLWTRRREILLSRLQLQWRVLVWIWSCSVPTPSAISAEFLTLKTEVLFPEPGYQLADYNLRYSEAMIRSRCRCYRICLPPAIIQGVRFSVGYSICSPSMKRAGSKGKFGEDSVGTAITFK